MSNSIDLNGKAQDRQVKSVHVCKVRALACRILIKAVDVTLRERLRLNMQRAVTHRNQHSYTSEWQKDGQIETTCAHVPKPSIVFCFVMRAPCTPAAGLFWKHLTRAVEEQGQWIDGPSPTYCSSSSQERRTAPGYLGYSLHQEVA